MSGGAAVLLAALAQGADIVEISPRRGYSGWTEIARLGVKWSA
jgi:hypothetical protein